MSIGIVVLLCLFALLASVGLVLFGCSWLLFWCVCVLCFVVLVSWLSVLLLVFGFELRFWVWVIRVAARGGWCYLLFGLGALRVVGCDEFGLWRCSS